MAAEAAVAEVPMKDPAGEEKPKEEKAAKSVSYHKLFKFASWGDIALWWVGIAGAAWQGFVQVYMIVFFGDIMDDLMMGNNDNTMTMIRWFCYLGVMAFLSGWLMFMCCNMSMESQKQKMRLAYLSAVVHQDVSWFDQHEPGTLPERINSNIEKIAMGLGDKAGNLVMDLSMMATGFAFGFYFWWKLGLMILAIVPFMSLGAAVMGQAMNDLQQENQKWYGKAGSCCEEVMRALRTVISCRAETLECERYEALVKQASHGGVIAQTKVGIGMGYMMAVMMCSYGAAFWFGAFLVRDGEQKPSGEMYMAGDVMKTFFCVLFGGFALGMMGEPLQAITAASAAGGSLYEMLESKPSIETSDGSDKGAKVDAIQSIAFEEVHFNYPARPDIKVLNGCSLKIDAGQRVALVGESGSGKSTIIALIERFYDTGAGRVLINGVDIRELNINNLRSVIGYVGQEPVLFATSVRANIMYGNQAATSQERDAAVRDAQLDFVDSLPDKLETFVGSGGSQFSGGQKQRIALARALIKKPSLLLLDEATSALDNKSEKMVQETLDRLGSLDATKSLTTIEIAHRLSTVKNRDVIFVMKRGQVIESGKHEELMSQKGEYYALVASQEGSKGQETDEGGGSGDKPLSAKAEGVAVQGMERAVSPGEMARQVSDKDEEEEKRKEAILKTYSPPLTRIFGFCKPEWIWLMPGTIGALLFGAKEPAMAFVLFDAINKFYLPPDVAIADLWPSDGSPRHPALDKMYEDVSGSAMWFLLIGLASLVGGILQFASFGVMKEGLTRRMRSATMKHLMRMEVGYHDDPGHTPSKNVFALEMYAFRAGNMMTGIGAYANIFGALFVGIIMGFVLSWRMGLMMFGMIPVMAIAQYVGMQMMMVGQQGNSEEMKTAQQVISDSLNSIRTVRSLGAEDTLVALVGKWSEPVAKRGIRKSVGGGANFGISQGLTFFIFAFAFWWTMWLIDNGYNTFLEAMQAMGCILFGAMGMGQAAAMVGNISAAKVACHDLFKLLDRPSLIDGLDPKGATPEGEIQAVGRIEFKDVKFFYPFRPEVQVLKGVSFSIKEGQSVGLCGPSGGGKSTMLAMLQRFYDPQDGEILITDRQLPLHTVNISWWRQQMGYIGQEPILFDTTVRENVLYGLTGESLAAVTEEKLELCGQMAHLEFLKEQDAWETKVGPRGERLSGGQKQRVAICRALVRDPQIMLLDEATSALDSASEKVVQEALNNVLKNRTSFTIAHRLSTIEKSDVILTCAEGSIIEFGTHAELMVKDGVYRKLQEASHE